MVRQSAVRAATKVALRSCHRCRVGAVVTSGRRVLGSGFNQVNRHQSSFSSGHWPGSLHAEVAALLSIQAGTSLDKACLTVVRLKKTGGYGLAYPCKHCMETIIKAGIRKVVYSTETGFVEMRISNHEP